MKRVQRLLFLIAAVICVMPGAAFADGFAIYEWSAGGVGMADAYMFAEDDPSLLAYNPAGITKLKGEWFAGGLSYINPRGRADFHGGATDGKTLSNTEAVGWVPNVYYVRQQNERLWLGLGVFTRFGNSTQYDPSFPGAYNSYLAKITSLSVQPTIAYKLTPKLSVAAGADIMYIALDIKKKIPTSLMAQGLPDADFELDGDNIALGWNLAFNYDFTEKTHFAAVYRSKVEQNMDADINLTYPGQSTKGHGSVTLPDSLTLGFGHSFDDRTRVEIGAIYTKWSTYDALNVIFDRSILPPPFPGVTSSNDVKDWENVWRYQAGLERRLNDRWSILCGYSYDNSPIPDRTIDFMVPTGDRQTASIGFKYRGNPNSELAFAWGYMWIKNRTISGERYSPYEGYGDYAYVHDSTAHILSLSYTVRLK